LPSTQFPEKFVRFRGKTLALSSKARIALVAVFGNGNGVI
jgi:hypothetical protein